MKKDIVEKEIKYQNHLPQQVYIICFLFNSNTKQDENELKELKRRGTEIKNKVVLAEIETRECEEKLIRLCSELPNYTSPDTPIGDYDKAEIIIEKLKPEFSFKAQTYKELGKKLNLFDIEKGSTLAGTKFTVLQNVYFYLFIYLYIYSIGISKFRISVITIWS